MSNFLRSNFARSMLITGLCCVAACLRAGDNQQGCSSEEIQSISDNAADLVIASGRTFRFLGQDFIDPRVWEQKEEILVCVDTSLDNASGIYFFVKNIQRGETLKVQELDMDPGSPANAVAEEDKKFLSDLIGATSRGDAEWIARHTNYPIMVNINGKQKLISDKNNFVANFYFIFDEKIADAILSQKPDALFKTGRGVVIGGAGEIRFEEFYGYQEDGRPGKVFLIMEINN